MSKVVVYHAEYGCETGCCGHAIEVDGAESHFDFSHPYSPDDDFRKWAEDLIVEHGCDPADLDWDNCLVSSVW